MTDYEMNKAYLANEIETCKEAIARFSAKADFDAGLVAEFQNYDIETALIYTQWHRFHRDKVSYFKNRLPEIQQRYNNFTKFDN